jgi:hypothetical protein
VTWRMDTAFRVGSVDSVFGIASLVMVSFRRAVVGVGENIIVPTGTNTWVMHLNDAARYTISTAEANNILVQLRLAPSNTTPISPPQSGIGACSTSTITGTYFYLLEGSVGSLGHTTAYAELGKLVADGKGSVSGQSYASVGGQQSTYTLNGNYSVQSSCAGSISVSNGQTTNTLAFQIVDNQQEMLLAISSSSAVVVGTAYRETTLAGDSGEGER